MKLTQALAPVVALSTAVNALGETDTYWTTVVTTAFTTYCPSATTFVFSNVTYTATQETTLTITNCPCTISVAQHPPTTTSIEECTEDTGYTRTGGAGPRPAGTGSQVYSSNGGNYSTVITYTPPATTYLSGIVPITTSHSASRPTNPLTSHPTTLISGSGGSTPTKNPVGPSTSHPVTVPTAAAVKVGPVGLILAAGLAVIAL